MINDTPETSQPFTATDNATPQFEGIARTPDEMALLEAYRKGDHKGVRRVLTDREYDFWLTPTEKMATYIVGKLALMGYLDRRDVDGGMWDLVAEVAESLAESLPVIDNVSIERIRNGKPE